MKIQFHFSQVLWDQANAIKGHGQEFLIFRIILFLLKREGVMFNILLVYDNIFLLNRSK